MGYRITNESGEVRQEFRPEDFAKGDTGALYAAARRAHALSQAGETVLLSGPEGFIPRRYSPEYLHAAAGRRWPYRVPCSVPGCPNWIHPAKTRPEATCWTHFAQAPETAARAERMRRARRRREP